MPTKPRNCIGTLICVGILSMVSGCSDCSEYQAPNSASITCSKIFGDSVRVCYGKSWKEPVLNSCDSPDYYRMEVQKLNSDDTFSYIYEGEIPYETALRPKFGLLFPRKAYEINEETKEVCFLSTEPAYCVATLDE